MDEVERTFIQLFLGNLELRKIAAFALTDGEIYTAHGKYKIVKHGERYKEELTQELSKRGFLNGLHTWCSLESGRWEDKYVFVWNRFAEQERVEWWSNRVETKRRDEEIAQQNREREARLEEMRAAVREECERLRTEAKFKTVSFMVQTTPVAGYAFRGLVAHRRLDDMEKWNVSHLASTYSLNLDFSSKREAEIAVCRLTSLMSWTEPAADLAKNPAIVRAKGLIELMRTHGVYTLENAEDL